MEFSTAGGLADNEVDDGHRSTLARQVENSSTTCHRTFAATQRDKYNQVDIRSVRLAISDFVAFANVGVLEHFSHGWISNEYEDTPATRRPQESSRATDR
jgi:hypothetical protein